MKKNEIMDKYKEFVKDYKLDTLKSVGGLTIRDDYSSDIFDSLAQMDYTHDEKNKLLEDNEFLIIANTKMFLNELYLDGFIEQIDLTCLGRADKLWDDIANVILEKEVE